MLTRRCRTNASPIYVLLFLAATYALQRPCVYCSILLFVLVFSLFDFHADWFEPRWSSLTGTAKEAASSYMAGNATLSQVIIETASMAVSSTFNVTRGAVANATVDGAKRRLGAGGISNSTGGFDGIRGILERRQLRIPCVDVIVRL